jgi:hypothetical protein
MKLKLKIMRPRNSRKLTGFLVTRAAPPFMILFKDAFQLTRYVALNDRMIMMERIWKKPVLVSQGDIVEFDLMN